jgi:hypothetical protein
MIAIVDTGRVGVALGTRLVASGPLIIFGVQPPPIAAILPSFCRLSANAYLGLRADVSHRERVAPSREPGTGLAS